MKVSDSFKLFKFINFSKYAKNQNHYCLRNLLKRLRLLSHHV